MWEGASSRGYRLLHTVSTGGVPVVAVAVRSDFFVVARMDGIVQVYGLVSGRGQYPLRFVQRVQLIYILASVRMHSQ